MTTGREVVVIAAWHLARGRDLPRAFLAVRRLDRATRGLEGARLIHRWVSRRSVALETRWVDQAAAQAWLASDAFLGAAARLDAFPGSRRVERLQDV